jgi:two-component system, cell cycle response regulator
MPALTHNRVLPRAALALLAAGMALLATHTLLGVGGEGFSEIYDRTLYDGLMAGAAVLCLVRVLVSGHDRIAWLLIGIGLCGWAIGDIIWTTEFAGQPNPPFPSWADAGYLLFFPAAIGGLALLTRHRVGRLPAILLLDALIVALAVCSIGIEVLLDLVASEASGGTAERVAAIAYPAGDILVLAFLGALLVATGGLPGRAWGLIGAGMAINAFADAAYSFSSYSGTYAEGSWIDLLWPLGAILIAGAAWQRWPRRSRRLPQDWRALALPVGVAMFVSIRFALQFVLPIEPAAQIVLAFIFVLIVARLIVTLQENLTLLTRVETDALTGLGNLGKLNEDLRVALDSDRPHELALFDLDGFKLYNDSFGHPAGDALLHLLGGRLRESMEGIGNAYRIGGDEFCVLLSSDTSRSTAALAVAAEALRERGDGFEVTVSFGTAEVPREAGDPEAALQIADRRMYAQKESRRTSAGQQARAVLLRALGERVPDLGEHVRNVSRVAVAIGRQLGFAGTALTDLRRAAELHDIGKMSIPDAILDKPGPLTEDEWDWMRQHTEIGQRILSSAPALAGIAPIVRSSHERVDGQGYPDGLAGEAIPLASRIIFVSDTYDAMTSDRPYSPARTAVDALVEVKNGVGTRFDPIVVDALVEVVAAGRLERTQVSW